MINRGKIGIQITNLTVNNKNPPFSWSTSPHTHSGTPISPPQIVKIGARSGHFSHIKSIHNSAPIFPPQIVKIKAKLWHFCHLKSVHNGAPIFPPQIVKIGAKSGHFCHLSRNRSTAPIFGAAKDSGLTRNKFSGASKHPN